MAIDAGTVSIGLDADLKQFNDQMKQSAALVAASTASMRAQLDSLQATLARINGSGNLDPWRRSIEQFSASTKRVSETSTPLRGLESDFKRVAEAAGLVALSKAGVEAFTTAVAKGALSSTSSMSGLASSLTNVYRAARLAFSPTLFTAGSLAAGYALEKVGEAAYKTAGTLQNQGTIAGLNKVPISTAQVGELAQLGGDKNFQALLGLYNTSGGKNLRDIAEQLSAIKDPADKARAAVSLFGSDASTALRLLNQSFVENADRVKDWNLAYSDETRSNLAQFKEDIDSLKAPFEGFGNSVSAAGEKTREFFVTLFASGYGKLRDGSLIRDALAPFNLERNFPSGSSAALDSFGSGLSGFLSTEGASIRDGRLGGLFSTADAQYARELERNTRQNKPLQDALRSASQNFPQGVIPDSLTSLDQFNQGKGVEDLRERLEALKSQRSKVLSAYFTRDPEGKLQFKDDLSSVQQANATTTLGTLDKNIGGLQASIDAFKPQKTQVDAGARQLQQLAAEAAAARAELARFPSNGDPFLEALAKSAARASEEIAKINSERKQLGEKPLSLAEISNTSANALTIQLSRLQIDSKQKQAEIDKDLVDGAARLNQELAKQDAEEQKKLAVINAQTAAIRVQIDAVGKGFAAQRQAALAGITTRGTAAEERPEAIQAQIAQSNAQSDLDVKATLNQIAQQSAALKREIDAVFKGRDAVRQAEIENIRAQGLNPDIEQARISYAQAQFALQDKQRGVGETANQGVRQWLQEMSDATNSVGKEVHDVLGGAFQGLDKQLTDIITGQKTSWASFLRGIAAQIATLTLNNAFAGIAKQLIPQAGGGSASGIGSAAGGLGGILGPLLRGLGGGASASGGAGSIAGDAGALFGSGSSGTSGIFSFLDNPGASFNPLQSLFGGFMAEGGPLQSSKWYIAGEHGPEAIWGGGSGAFAGGYGKSGGGTINNYVDARGSSNSAETELRMRRGLAEAHKQGARDGAAVSQERRRRVPNSKAFAS